MKTLAVAGMVTALLGGIWLLSENTEVYKKSAGATTTPEVIEKQVDALEARINAAIEAEMAHIEALAQEAYKSRIEAEKAKIEASVLSEYEAEVKARRIEVEKEVGSY